MTSGLYSQHRFCLTWRHFAALRRARLVKSDFSGRGRKASANSVKVFLATLVLTHELRLSSVGQRTYLGAADGQRRPPSRGTAGTPSATLHCSTEDSSVISVLQDYFVSHAFIHPRNPSRFSSSFVPSS